MNKLARVLKTSRVLYSIYFYLMSFVMKVIGVFVGFDEKLILFNCFGGKKYDDNPKAIYECMLSDARFDGFKLVWALQNPNSTSVPGRAQVVKSDSFKFFVTALRAKVWVTNSSMERGLSFKKRKTVCLNTWHGTPIKVMGIDIKDENTSFKSKILVRADRLLAQGQYDVDTFSHCFKIPKSNIVVSGAPRNDDLVNSSPEQVDRIREKLKIEDNKMVILYAPTFREFSRGSANEVVLNVPIDLQKWQDTLGNTFVVLFRAHYEVAKHMKVEGYSMFRDVSTYPNLNELMIVSDALISDYSSIFFDYSVMHKPMYCFAYDYNVYLEQRGMYLNLEKELPCTIRKNEDDLIADLQRFDVEKQELSQKTIKFQEKYVTEYGNAASKACDLILNCI